MNSKALLATATCVCTLSMAIAAFGQGRGTPPPPASDTVAPDIPGVVAAGTKVHVIKDGFNGSEGTIALPDGSVIFSETTANRTIKIDKDDTCRPSSRTPTGRTGCSSTVKGACS